VDPAPDTHHTLLLDHLRNAGELALQARIGVTVKLAGPAPNADSRTPAVAPTLMPTLRYELNKRSRLSEISLKDVLRYLCFTAQCRKNMKTWAYSAPDEMCRCGTSVLGLKYFAPR
jgi:hypothetical protein